LVRTGTGEHPVEPFFGLAEAAEGPIATGGENEFTDPRHVVKNCPGERRKWNDVSAVPLWPSRSGPPLAESNKLVDASIKLTEQTLAPLTARVTGAVETFGKAA
jgi:hypothetical protein